MVDGVETNLYFPDGTFKPKGNLTRGEVSAVMVRLCEIRG